MEIEGGKEEGLEAAREGEEGVKILADSFAMLLAILNPFQPTAAALAFHGIIS